MRVISAQNPCPFHHAFAFFLLEFSPALELYKDFKDIARSLGYENARFHDLRHSYAVAAIESGDDIKTVQANLGHATASFTLDVYGHASQRMRQRSADRMERYIHEVLDN